MNSRVLPLLSLLIAVLIVFGYVRPLWQGPIAATKAAIASDNAALAAAAEYTAEQNKLAAARAAIDPEQLERLSVFLPDSVDNVGIILDLNALAARSQLALVNVDVTVDTAGAAAAAAAATTNGKEAPLPQGGVAAAIPRPNPLGWVDLSLSAIGSYSAFQTFLASIEKSARLLDVREIAVKGSDTGVYSYQLTLRLYWLR